MLVRDLKEEQHHQKQLGGQSFPKSWSLCLPGGGFHWSPSPQGPGMLWGPAASSCLIPLPWGSRREKGTPRLRVLNLFVPLLALCPGPCCPSTARACLDPPKGPGFRENRPKKPKNTPGEVLVVAPKVVNKCFILGEAPAQELEHHFSLILG